MTALSILRAALERMAADAAPDKFGNCIECEWPAVEGHSMECKAYQARAALEAAAKAPGLADDEGSRDAACTAVSAYGMTTEETILCAHAVLRAVDAYYRGSK